jgi:hypothetical protein
MLYVLDSHLVASPVQLFTPSPQTFFAVSYAIRLEKSLFTISPLDIGLPVF